MNGWDESKVNRHPAGSGKGGQFAEKWAGEVSARIEQGGQFEAISAEPDYLGTERVGGKRRLTEQQRAARCYELTGYAATLGGQVPDGTVLVHGTVHGVRAPGPIDHAWLVLPDGRIWEPMQAKYWHPLVWQAIARPTNEHRYTQDQARLQMIESGTYGPWEGGGAALRPMRISTADPLDEVKARAVESGVELHAFRIGGGQAFKVGMIKTEKIRRNQGLGRAAMEDLIRLADREGLPIVLTPDSETESTMSRRRLIAWYKSMGFVPSRGRNNWTWDSMIRFPQGGS